MFFEERLHKDSLIRHGVANLDGLLTVDQERCHPPYEMCRKAHVIEFPNECSRTLLLRKRERE